MSFDNSHSSPGDKKRWRFYVAAGFVFLAALLALEIRFNVKGHFEGVYLLKGGPGSLLEIADDIYLGDGSRLVWGVDLDYSVFHLVRKFGERETDGPYLACVWDEKEGDGYVRSFFGGGRQLITCFARFDDVDKHEHGLFVGGGLPANVREDAVVKLNQTGMAYYDGKVWNHVWCSVNEGLASPISPEKVPSYKWKFLGSKVLQSTKTSLTLRSSHEVVMDGVPLHIDRHAYFGAGDTYFVLTVRITNTGSHAASYFYCYGDEPWVGDYGSSKGNVGWVKDGLVKYVQWVDTAKYTYAGYYDYGNDAIGEGHGFSRTADFIEWLGDNRPEYVFFSNAPYEFPSKDNVQKPLSSDQRFIGLQWGPRILQPGQSEIYSMAIGMAGYDPKTDFPVKPAVDLENIK